MAECIVLKGGNGADLDVITAGVPDVLTGKVIVDKDGNPLTGTMANNGAVSQALNAGGSYTVPVGYHNGSGKVTANSLASQTSATAAAAQILSPYTAWVNGSKLTGSIASLAGQTITPNASQQTVSSSGKYMTGNVVVNAVSNLSAGNIKKGVVVGGVTGTFEGYVPNATDLYYRGNNVKNFVSSNTEYISLEAGQISIPNKDTNIVYIQSGTSVSLVGYTYLNVSYVCTAKAYNYVATLRFGIADDTTLDVAYISVTEDGTKSFNLAGYQRSGYARISLNKWSGYIYRIWLS